MVACCVVKSSADVKEVDDNTLRVLVNQCFETSDINLRKAIYSELRDALFYSRNPRVHCITQTGTRRISKHLQLGLLHARLPTVGRQPGMMRLHDDTSET